MDYVDVRYDLDFTLKLKISWGPHNGLKMHVLCPKHHTQLKVSHNGSWSPFAKNGLCRY